MDLIEAIKDAEAEGYVVKLSVDGEDYHELHDIDYATGLAKILIYGEIQLVWLHCCRTWIVDTGAIYDNEGILVINEGY